jgi:hypothetical protein
MMMMMMMMMIALYLTSTLGLHRGGSPNTRSHDSNSMVNIFF